MPVACEASISKFGCHTHVRACIHYIKRLKYTKITKLKKKTLSRPVIFFFLNQADLSSYEAEKTLSYYEKRLLSLRMKTCMRVVSHSGMAATHQKAVKIIAHKNGDGYRNGKLIVAETFPVVSGYHLNASCILRGNDNGDKKKTVGLSDNCPWPVSPI